MGHSLMYKGNKFVNIAMDSRILDDKVGVRIANNTFEQSNLQMPASTAFIYTTYFKNNLSAVAKNLTHHNTICGLKIKSRGLVVDINEIIRGAKKITKYIKS